MDETLHLVTLKLDDQFYALPLATIDRVFNAVAITPLSDAPHFIPGVVNIQGDITPVIDLRARLGFEKRDIQLTDHFVLVKLEQHAFVLITDRVLGMTVCHSKELVDVDDFLPQTRLIKKMLKRPEGIVFLLDVETVASTQEKNESH